MSVCVCVCVCLFVCVCVCVFFFSLSLSLTVSVLQGQGLRFRVQGSGFCFGFQGIVMGHGASLEFRAFFCASLGFRAFVEGLKAWGPRLGVDRAPVVLPLAFSVWDPVGLGLTMRWFWGWRRRCPDLPLGAEAAGFRARD